jgi:hypothetical protein
MKPSVRSADPRSYALEDWLESRLRWRAGASRHPGRHYATRSGYYLASGLVVQSAGFAGKNLMMGTMAFMAAWPIWLFLAE